MRMMLRWTVPVERGNETIEDGSLARTLEALMEELGLYSGPRMENAPG